MTLDITKAADTLARARKDAAPLEALPEGARPVTAEEGYAVQKAFIDRWDEPVAGWKAGATLDAVQKRFGLDQPFLGPIFASGLMQSPASIAAKTYDLSHGRNLAVEVEFAFRLGRELPPKAAGWSEADVLDAVEALVPAIEIISSRYREIPGGNPGPALADCGLNGGIVLAAPAPDWRSVDLAAHATRLIVNGKTEVEGTGALVLGHPLRSLVWLVNNVGRLGHTLAKGQVLTTGSMTGIYQVPVGATAIGDFGKLGQVEIRVV